MNLQYISKGMTRTTTSKEVSFDGCFMVAIQRMNTIPLKPLFFISPHDTFHLSISMWNLVAPCQSRTSGKNHPTRGTIVLALSTH